VNQLTGSIAGWKTAISPLRPAASEPGLLPLGIHEPIPHAKKPSQAASRAKIIQRSKPPHATRASSILNAAGNA